MIRSCTAMVILAGALASVAPAGAAPHRPVAAARPAPVGRCGGGAHRLQTAYIPGGAPTCCIDSLGCAEFLSTTTIVHVKAPTRS